MDDIHHMGVDCRGKPSPDEPHYCMGKCCPCRKAKSTHQKTRDFPRDQPIDATLWSEFTLIGETYRTWRIRYTVDASGVAEEKGGE